VVTTPAQVQSAESIVAMLRAYADNPSAFLTLNDGNEYFSVPGLDGVITYRRAGRYLIQFGGPFADLEHRAGLLAEFVAFAAKRRLRVVALQLQHADALLYAGQGFTVNQLGSSYALELSTFTLRGSKFMQLRNKISRAKRCGLEITQTTADDCADAVATIDRTWLREKGRHVKKLEFLVGELAGAGAPYRKLFLATVGEEAVGYISYSPVFGSRPGWLHDLSRRAPAAPPGAMEAINVAAIEAARADGAAWLHFGFTPFAGLDRTVEMPSASPMVSRFVRLLAEHGEKVYPARTQVAYKEKWGPDVILPEYLAFHGKPSLGAIWKILRVTRSI
jgi:lysylphosphatidylglycerol synthetase-like protein (DUF2156 family)